MAIRTPEPKHWLVIPAAGIGSRMAAALPKQYLKIHDKSILQTTIEAITSVKCFEGIFVGLHPNDQYFSSTGLDSLSGVTSYIGGAERADTVLKGLEAIESQADADDWVWVHDAARPLISPEEINALESALLGNNVGALLALQCTDTMKHCSDDGVIKTVDRSSLWRAQTPQVFRYTLLLKALKQGLSEGWSITDESSAIEQAGFAPNIVAGKNTNIKVTHPEDLVVAEQNGKPVQATVLSGKELDKKRSTAVMRIGSGYDVHAFEEGEFITLGGVQIPHSQGLKAHSDGDVLLHAICDALLGALALGDIGHHFPDTDPKWAGADSRALLRAVLALVKAKGYKVQNVDSTIIAQAPKMAPYISQMRANIAADLEREEDCVSVKATTTEKLGFTGRKEGIASQATVLLVANS